MMAFPCLRPQKSCVVTFQSYRQQALPQGFAGEVEMDEADPNEYVFELSQSSGSASGASGGGSDSSGSTVAAALSNRGIGLFEGASLRALGELTGHTGTITDVAFNPANPHLLLSCAEDGSARGWDLRMKAQAAQFDHGAGQEVLNLSLGCGGTMLATACGEAVHFWDARTGNRVGCYADNHTDLVTQVSFNPFNQTEVASGSEDGLVCVYDTRQASAEESLQCVINADCAVRRVCWFAPGGEGLCVLTGSETMSLWHKHTGQCLNPQHTQVRSLLAVSPAVSVDPAAAAAADREAAGAGVQVDYLIGAHFEASTGRLLLAAGDFAGGAVLCEVTNQSVTPLASLQGGHSATIRSCLWQQQQLSGGGEGGGDGPVVSLLTGGEDARLCAWNLAATTTTDAAADGGAATTPSTTDAAGAAGVSQKGGSGRSGKKVSASGSSRGGGAERGSGNGSSGGGVSGRSTDKGQLNRPY